MPPQIVRGYMKQDRIAGYTNIKASTSLKTQSDEDVVGSQQVDRVVEFGLVVGPNSLVVGG